MGVAFLLEAGAIGAFEVVASFCILHDACDHTSVLSARMVDPETPSTARGRPGQQSDDPRVSLAYDAALAKLSRQNGTLDSIRSRSASLLAAGVVVTTLVSTLGHVHSGRKGDVVISSWASWVTIAILIAIAGITIYVLLPVKDWAFGASPAVILQLVDEGQEMSSIQRTVAQEMITDGTTNEGRLTTRVWCFRGIVVSLLAEIVVLLIGLATD